MDEGDAPPGTAAVGVRLAAAQLPWLIREVADRGGELILSLEAAVALSAGQQRPCPLSEAERDAVGALTSHDTWDAAARAVQVPVSELRARLRTARRRLRIRSDLRLVAICLSRGWVPVPGDLGFEAGLGRPVPAPVVDQ